MYLSEIGINKEWLTCTTAIAYRAYRDIALPIYDCYN